jgi:hypothetical protein
VNKSKSTILLLAFILTLVPSSSYAQRFGGDYGAAAGVWVLFVDPGVDSEDSFGRDLGGVIAFGGRLFFQTGRVRLGGAFFGGGFAKEGVNAAGFDVSGGLSGGGFTAEYLAVQHNLELSLGGMVGGGTLNVEELLGVSSDVESINRRRDTVVLGYPWARLGYNPAPFVNVGLEVGYMLGTQGVGGFSVGFDIFVGLIP